MAAAACAKRHGGVRLGKHQMCEDCHDKHANFGKVGSTKRLWCGECAKAHGGVNLSRQGKRHGTGGSLPARKRRRRGVPAESAGPAACVARWQA